MSYRSFKREMQKKREEDKVKKELNGALRTLEKKRTEYAEKAKTELKKGNNAQYGAYVALLKNTMFYISQTNDMIANYIIATDLRSMQTLSKHFISSMNSVMKDVYKISKAIHVSSSQKVFNKALDKQNYTAAQLQQLLSDNSIAFESSVNSLSDITDEEVRSVLEEEIKKDEQDTDVTLSLLEKKYATTKPQAVAGTISGGGVAANSSQSTGFGTSPAGGNGSTSQKPANEQLDGTYAADNGGNDSNHPTETADVKGADSGERKVENGQINVYGAAFRPQRLADYVGQPNAVAMISDPIKKAKLTDKALPHVLLCGSYGQGKTTLAKIIANEMGGNFIEITPSIKPRDLLRILRGLKKGDIIFIDEVHKLSTEIIETMLYPAMEDYEVHFTEGNSQRTDSRTEKIAPFTLIGATTETGKLLKPFYSKFPINITLCEYKIDTIASIIKNSFRVNGMTISDELCFAIAERSRLSPRTANAYVEGIASSAIVREADERNITGKGALGGNSAVANLNIEITKQDVDDYFNKLGVDEKGLKEEERKILRIIIEMYGGGPVGQENIAKALNVSTNRVDQEYEPYLVKLGLLVVRPQGRFATDAAYEYLGLNKSAKDDGKQD